MNNSSNFFEVKISYQNEVEGKIKKVNDAIMVDALSFAEAELKTERDLGAFDYFKIKEIKRSNYNEIFVDEEEKKESYFKCKVKTTIINEETGKDQKGSAYYLINAKDVASALVIVNEQVINQSTVDMELEGISKTAISDVIYQETKQIAGIDMVDIKCDDLEATVERKLIQKDKFDITFEGGLILSFESLEFGKECVSASTADGESKDIYVGKMLEYRQ